MSNGKLSHLQINVKQENLPFYKDLFTFLGWGAALFGRGIRGIQQRGRCFALVHGRSERRAE